MAIWSQFNDVDCRKCSTQIKLARGCDDVGREAVIEGYTINRCPVKYSTPEVSFYMLGYQNYQKGILPNAGGWLEQPIKFYQAMLLIDRLVAKFEEEKCPTKIST